MNIFRLLVLLGLGWLVYRLLQNWRVEITPRHPPQPPPDRFEPMARCTSCGLHLPAQSLSPAGRCGACEKNRS